MSNITDFEGINRKIKRLKFLLVNEDLHIEDTNVRDALIKFLKFKEIIGNIDMDIHFLVSYLANSFLKKKHDVTINLDKAVGSSGLDIELEQVVAEIKTTSPYLERLWSKPKSNYKKGFRKIRKFKEEIQILLCNRRQNRKDTETKIQQRLPICEYC